MRTYPDAFTFLLREIRAVASCQAKAATARIDQLYKEAVWRLNEAEAVVHVDFFAARWQTILPQYGERRCVCRDDFEYWHGHGSKSPWTIHHGKPYRP